MTIQTEYGLPEQIVVYEIDDPNEIVKHFASLHKLTKEN